MTKCPLNYLQQLQKKPRATVTNAFISIWL